jgi:D-glycero-alpha-D-manno-heptose-7-phosphate kinase
VSVVWARAPLRISFGGGGTDLPSYFVRHGGFVVSAAIDRHVHMLAATAFQREGVRLKHLEFEDVARPSEVRHPILRAALERHWNGRPIELASVADVPPGTGLGSSGAYTVCAVKALGLAAGDDPGPSATAEAASVIELEVLGRTVGKQDQYVSAHGGLNAMTFGRDGSVGVRRLELPPATRAALRDHFLLFFSGERRSAADQLGHQVRATLAGDASVEENLHRTKSLALETCAALESGDLDRCAELMELQWRTKSGRAPGMVTERIEQLRSAALAAGARAVMLMGAGGGGFTLVYAPEPAPVRAAMEAAGALELGFDLDDQGCVGSTPRDPG